MTNNNDDSTTTILVKLDWYYTTATIKTSMDHPTRGLNQLFGKQVTPKEYIHILQNPRTHPNVRYRTTRGGRGRGSGGRGSRTGNHYNGRSGFGREGGQRQQHGRGYYNSRGRRGGRG